MELVVSVQETAGAVEGDIRNWNTDHAICRGLHGKSLEMIIFILMRFNFLSKLLPTHVFRLVVIEEPSDMIGFHDVVLEDGTCCQSVVYD